jgi:hypothetical protein
MTLLIEDKQGFVDLFFGKWLIPKITADIINRIDKSKLLKWDDYLTNSSSLARIYSKNYRAYDVLVFAAKNIICTGTKGSIVIKIDDNIMMPGFDRVKVKDLVKLITNGNLEVKGYPVVSDVFNDFANNINKYMRLYYQV